MLSLGSGQIHGRLWRGAVFGAGSSTRNRIQAAPADTNGRAQAAVFVQDIHEFELAPINFSARTVAAIGN